MRKAFLGLALAALAASQTVDISGERIRAHTRFLSSDLMEGRGVATRGDTLATEYLATAFALAGAKPGGDKGTFFQNVTLVGVATDPSSQLSISGKGSTIPLQWLEEFVGANQRQTAEESLDAELIFVGHGISAPEYNWDSFKNADVRGKILLQFTNEPISQDPKFFGGKALTYYGRWTYKYEEAQRRGALGSIIIHTTPNAGYGWEVVRNSWGREQSFVKVQPGRTELAFAGWITSDAANKVLALAGRNVEELLKLANDRAFQPIPLGLRVQAKLVSKVREQHTRNVIAVVPGSDPKLKDEAVIYSGHWDHLGIGEPLNGDSIYNGAIDNATGLGMLIEMARAWAALPQKPKRSAIFMAVTAEEQGLRGSEYWAGNPTVPPGKVALALNFDSFAPYGRVRDVVMTGAERTTFWPAAQEVAKRFQLTIKPDRAPEQGSYYRSDHFSFALAGIPAFSVGMGGDYVRKPPAPKASTYHQPTDEYSEDWDFAGMEQMAQFGVALGLEAASAEKLPSWQPGDEFLRARENSWKK